MSGTKPANLTTTSKDFPQELLDQLNYVVSDIYAWISELRGEGFKHSESSSDPYITADGVTFENLDANGDVGTGSTQLASGDRGVENGNNHDHVGGDGAAITEAAITLAANTTNNVSITKHGFCPVAPNLTTQFLRGDAAWAALPARFVDRGDPAAWDVDLAALTTDGAWHDLDLSAIVPAGAIAVLLFTQVKDDATNSFIMFRKNGNSNEYNVAANRTQTVDIYNGMQHSVFLDSSRVIEYKATNTTFTNIYILVCGWWI